MTRSRLTLFYGQSVEQMSMRPSSNSVDLAQPSRTMGGVTRVLKLFWLGAACVLVALFSADCRTYAQLPSAPTSAQTGAQPENTSDTASSDESEDTETEESASTTPSSTTPQTALSSDQIINILQQSPDLVLDLKSQLSDQLKQRGIQIDPNDISDEMLYNQISSSASLRANITTVLRARGYVSTDDLQSAGSSGTDQTQTSLFEPPSAPDDSVAEGSIAGSSRSSGESVRQSGAPLAAQPMGKDHNGDGRPRNTRGKEKANASTDLPAVVSLPAPYNFEAMHDLYAQIPMKADRLTRFGSDVFINRDNWFAGAGNSSQNTPLDVPLGPDYVIGPGDTLTIALWGGMTRSFTRTVGGDGRIFLPEAGAIQVAGIPLGRAQELIEAELKSQYRGAQVAVTVSRLRSLRVYIVGDVQQPGGYDISALATPLSALYAAGGPTAVGSLRTLMHYRGKQMVETVDLYDFLLHGIRNGSAPFESGDTLLVPPAGPEVAVSGAVRRPAIYEMKTGATTLASVIEDAGGFTAAASLNQIRIERIDANQQRVTVTLPENRGRDPQADQDAINGFQVKDGDRIRVEPILPYSQRAVYLAGHVVRPGRLPYTEGMRLTDVLRSYRDLLPEPAERGEVVRLVAPDLHAETIDFDVPEVLIGNTNVDLRPFDTIRIFGRYEVDAPTVTIRGEVLRPGRYPLSKGMTAAQLVRMAGGFKRDALRETADLASYDVDNGKRIIESLKTVDIGAAVSGADPKADVPLKPGDIFSIHQITNWNDIGESVTIRGQVEFPGSYGFKDGERLSAVLRRAGGLLPTAYPAGAVLVREQVRELEQSSRDELVRQIETNSAAARLSPSLAGSNAVGALELINAQQRQVLSELKSHPPNGRMVIHINADIDSWANTPADIELRRGDELTIPKRPGFVLITGQVYNATAVTYSPGRTADWYLRHAGGTNATANRKEIFIIRANGSVVGRRSGGWFEGDVLSTKLNPGDVVVVPQKIIGGSLFWRNLLSAGQLAGSIAITAGVAAAAL